MKHSYNVKGMTCEGCYHTVKSTLEKIKGVVEAHVNWQVGSAEVEMTTHVPTNIMEEALQKAGSKYHIQDHIEHTPAFSIADDVLEKGLAAYKPLFLIVAFIAGTTLLTQYPFQAIDGMLWMRHFMAGFFIVFAFFKLLNLQGFASSYSMYDIVAAKWYGWGFIYPFVELILGVAYLINFNSTATNWATIIVLGVSSIGVIQSNVNKRMIKCACLGDVFNLPMSTVTIVEDLSMVAMAAWMLIY